MMISWGNSQLFVSKCENKRTVDGSHDEADLCGVRGTGEMRVDLLCLVLVERDEAVQNVVASRGVVGTTWKGQSANGSNG